MPRVSVILPAYNAEDTVAETVRSVLDQQYEDFELLVCDDGSADGTVRVVEAFRDPRIRVLKMDHAGVAATRNRGLERAKGEFVAFIDADDLWSPDKLGAQVRQLEQCPNAAAVYSWTVFVDEEGCFLSAQEPVHHQGDVFPQMLLGCFVGSGSNLMVRRSCLSGVGNFDSGLTSSEDWDCWLRLARRWPFALVPRFQVFYRLRIGSASGDVAQIGRDGEKVTQRVFRTAPARMQAFKKNALANGCIYLAFLWLIRGADRQSLREAGREIAKAFRLQPRMALSRRFWTHAGQWMLLHLVPERRRPRMSLSLLRLSGRWQARRWPELLKLLGPGGKVAT